MLLGNDRPLLQRLRETLRCWLMIWKLDRQAQGWCDYLGNMGDPYFLHPPADEATCRLAGEAIREIERQKSLWKNQLVLMWPRWYVGKPKRR